MNKLSKEYLQKQKSRLSTIESQKRTFESIIENKDEQSCMVLQKSMSNDDLDTVSLRKREFTPLDEPVLDTLSQKEKSHPNNKDALKVRYQQKFQNLQLCLNFKNVEKDQQKNIKIFKNFKNLSKEMKDKNDSYLLRRNYEKALSSINQSRNPKGNRKKLDNYS